GAGVSAWTSAVNVPASGGPFEFRLFLGNGYTRAATSVPFGMDASPSLAVSATSVTGGSSVTVTLANGLGGATDWLALAATSAANTSYLQWTYAGTGVTPRTWTVTVPASGGPFEFRLFLNNGYTRAAT